MTIRAVLGAWCLLTAMAATASAAPCPSPIVVEQAFPASGDEQTRWSVSVCTVAGFGLVVGTTSFRVAPGAAFVQILSDARVSQIFVPYHDGAERFYDISGFSQLVALGDVECPPGEGSRIASNRVCVEVRDRGLAWVDAGSARRGEDLVVWGVLDAGNYKYLMEWTFRDDGVIQARVGATGHNLPVRHDVHHTHTITWRLDVDLDGPANSARVGRHREVGLIARDSEMPIIREAALVWDPLQFTTLNVYGSGLAFDGGRPTSYRLLPSRAGTARHAEVFTHYDFWVTRLGADKSAQMNARDLPSYVTPPESAVDQDIVIWYTASLHHVVRDEDHGPTQIMSTGFSLVPFNFFEASPLYP